MNKSKATVFKRVYPWFCSDGDLKIASQLIPPFILFRLHNLEYFPPCRLFTHGFFQYLILFSWKGPSVRTRVTALCGFGFQSLGVGRAPGHLSWQYISLHIASTGTTMRPVVARCSCLNSTLLSHTSRGTLCCIVLQAGTSPPPEREILI